ncbi:ribosomal protein S18-alanine N-acetyltransferase [bacterium]|nr:ribosomal protein S18-alanine N-acetyltransferase [bacterium]
MSSLLRRLRTALGMEPAPVPPGLGALVVRSMTLRDLGGVGALEGVSFGSPWRTSSYARAVGDPNQHFFVAEQDGHMVGYTGFWVETGSAHIAKLAVHPDCRRQGIGAVLLEHMLDEVRRLGLGRAHLEVRRGNAEAQALYRRFGFRFERVQPQAYPNDREDALVLVRDDLLDTRPSVTEDSPLWNERSS